MATVLKRMAPPPAAGQAIDAALSGAELAGFEDSLGPFDALRELAVDLEAPVGGKPVAARGRGRGAFGKTLGRNQKGAAQDQ